jgi:transposase-like protein
MDTSGSGRRRNRSWPEALKREIVASSFAAGASVSVIARRYDVNANQVFRWRQLYRNGLPAAADPAAARLLPVIVAGEERGDVAPAPRALDTIEIELAGRYRVRVGSGVDGTALRRVLDVLERR